MQGSIKEKIQLQYLFLNDEAIQVVRILLYFDIFKYPLTALEIFERSKASSLQSVNSELDFLISNGYVLRFGIYFTINGTSDWVTRRQSGNSSAVAAMSLAKKYSRWMQMIPFVRSVFLSGSISKDYMDENSDIDYFVVVKKDRLFIARMFFVLMKRTLLRKKLNHLCFNYMVTTDNMSLHDYGFYPAIELMTLKPMFNGLMYEQLLDENPWASRLFPNYPLPDFDLIPSDKHVIQKIVEMFFPDWFAQRLDNWLFHKTKTHWENKFPKILFQNSHKNMFISKQEAKGHNLDYFDSFNLQWQKNIEVFCRVHNTCLDEKYFRRVLR